MQRSGRATKSLAKEKEMNSELSFFKVMTSSCQKMDFPPESVVQLQGILGRRVTLRDVDKNLWTVEVERGGDGYFFSKGWPQFFHENNLQPHDFVVFMYKHENLFDFRLFGRNNVEKKGIGCPEFRVEGEAEEVEEFTNMEEDEDEDDEEYSDDDDDDEDYSDDDDDDMVDDKESDEMEEVDAKEVEEARNISKAKHKSRSSSSSSMRHKKHNVGDHYEHDIFRSGLATQPKNPYFVSRSRKSRKNELYIPNDVIKGLNLKIPEKLFLVDGSGRKWKTKIKKWKDGRVWCTGGWKGMCRMNNIGVHDTCICEFVQEGRDPLYMLVRVVDAASK